MTNLPKHLFAGSDGKLYDTRRKHWHTGPPLRSLFSGANSTDIKTGAELRAELRAGKRGWPGYPKAFIVDDGAPLCYDCVRRNIYECILSIRLNVDDGWRVIRVQMLDADDMRDDDEPHDFPGTYCADCDELIE